jgi:hypothetical protein
LRRGERQQKEQAECKAWAGHARQDTTAAGEATRSQ